MNRLNEFKKHYLKFSELLTRLETLQRRKMFLKLKKECEPSV